MHQREVLAAGGATFSDTMHVALGGVTVLLMFLTIGVGATAFGKPFRLYSIATVVVLLTFGALTFVEAPRLQANLPTPWIGLWERINFSRTRSAICSAGSPSTMRVERKCLYAFSTVGQKIDWMRQNPKRPEWWLAAAAKVGSSGHHRDGHLPNFRSTA
jgi:hypothetical protein